MPAPLYLGVSMPAPFYGAKILQTERKNESPPFFFRFFVVCPPSPPCSGIGSPSFRRGLGEAEGVGGGLFLAEPVF